jgi:hypothetical protein
MSAETIVRDELEKSIKRLLQINDAIANGAQDVDTSILQQQKPLVAAQVYALCVVQSQIKRG